MWIASIMIGLSFALRLDSRVSLLEKTVLFIEGIKIEMQYTHSSLPLIIQKFACQETFEQIQFIKACGEKIKNKEDFPTAWETSVKENICIYKNEEIDKLLSLGLILGTSNLDGQLSMLSMYSNYFSIFLNESKNQKDKYANIAVSLGVFIGLGLFVLVL